MAQQQVVALAFKGVPTSKLRGAVQNVARARGMKALKEFKDGCIELVVEGDASGCRMLAGDEKGALRALVPLVVKEAGAGGVLMVLEGSAKTPDNLLQMECVPKFFDVKGDGTLAERAVPGAVAESYVDEEPAPMPWDPADVRNALSAWMSGVAGQVLDETFAPIAGDEVERLYFTPPTSGAGQRIQGLLDAIATAKSHVLEPQPDGRTLVKVVRADGTKQQSFLKADEADELKKLLQART